MVSGFAASLFHPAAHNEVVDGRISFDGQALLFQSEATTLAIALQNLLVEADDESERIYFRDKDLPNLRIFTTDVSILDDPHFHFVRERLEKVATRREILRRLKIIGYAAGACLLLGWLVTAASGLMVRSLVSRVPQEWEQKAGEDAIAELKADGQLLQDSNRVAQLKSLVSPLLAVVPRGNEFSFYIMNDKSPNAFALPGGYIVVTSGLLELADNTELAGVIAHESAHVTQKHHARKIIAAAGPFLMFGIFLHSGSGLGNLLSEGSGLMMRQGFSQEYESEADRVGWQYLVAAKIDPRGMISMFRKFKAEEARLKIDGDVLQAFQSHPALDKRIDRLEKEWNKMREKSGFIELSAVDLRTGTK